MYNLEKDIPTSTRLWEVFDYDDGQLIRKNCPWQKVGTDNGYGYLNVFVDGAYYLAHKIIFCMHHGYWPDVVDHIDRDKTNNRIENLREASKSSNEANTGPRVTNTTGYKGVSFHKKAGKYRAFLKGKHLGLFNTAVEAARKYNDEALKQYGEFAYLNEVID